MTGDDPRPVGNGPELPEGDDVPTISCTQCNEHWDLSYELDELKIGNQALEQFALDHHRHVGHFPDDITPWIADCRHCPDVEQFLAETPAIRWGETHARHARHTIDLTPPDSQTSRRLTPEDVGDTTSRS